MPLSGTTRSSPSICVMEYGSAPSASAGSEYASSAGDARFMIPTVEFAARRERQPVWLAASAAASNPIRIPVRMGR
mgnify:CR=1 FL=1